MPCHLLRDPTVSAAAKLIYLALRHNAWARGRHTFYPGECPQVFLDRTYLIKDTGLGSETIRRGLAELERHSWIAVIRPNEHKVTATINGKERTIHLDRREPDRDPTVPRAAVPSLYILLVG
jgi:hypothetical protein